MNNNDIVPGFDDEQDANLAIALSKVEEVPACIVVSLSGYIDTYNSRFFQNQIERVIASGFAKLIFNCAELNYLSSTGIGSFMVFLKAVKPNGGDVVLLQTQPRVYEVFQLLGFVQYFVKKDTLEEAIRYFANPNSEAVRDVFPKVFACPICSKKLRSPKPGRFRCTECKTILAINNEGQVATD